MCLVPRPFQGIVLLCGDTAGLALTFGRERFQPFLEDLAVNMDCPDETLSFGIPCVFTDLSVTEYPRLSLGMAHSILCTELM